METEPHEVFQFNDEPKCVDLGEKEVYALFKNDYIDIMFDVDGNVLTREEKAEVMRKYLALRGKKFASGLTDIPPAPPEETND